MGKAFHCYFNYRMSKIALAHRLSCSYLTNKQAVDFVIRVLIICISWKIQLCFFFAALICSYPGKWISKLWFPVVGVISINILNVIRIILIIYAAHHYPERIQFNHNYVFNIAIYIFTFFMWVLWVNKISKTKVSKVVS